MNALNLTVEQNGFHPEPPAEDYSQLQDFLDILQLLIREPSVVGSEDSFFRVLRRELEELNINISYYHGVLVAQGNKPHDLILSAHIDRHGN